MRGDGCAVDDVLTGAEKHRANGSDEDGGH